MQEGLKRSLVNALAALGLISLGLLLYSLFGIYPALGCTLVSVIFYGRSLFFFQVDRSGKERVRNFIMGTLIFIFHFLLLVFYFGSIILFSFIPGGHFMDSG